MATVSLQGTTIWNDASTGVGRAEFARGPILQDRIEESFPRATFVAEKNNGELGAVHTLALAYRFNSRGDVSSHCDALNTLMRNFTPGTLAATGFSSLSNCRLVAWSMSPPRPVISFGSTSQFLVSFTLTIRQLQA